MQAFLITGGSKGLGASLVERSLNQGNLVLSISRSKPPAHPRSFHLQGDLSETEALLPSLARLIEESGLKNARSVHLINNAAALEPIGTLQEFSAQDIRRHLELNLTAPVLLSHFFLKHFESFQGWKSIVNIISGAASKAVPGWSLYCSSKAGLRMMTECMALDNSDLKTKILSLSPGVMDTEMQALIRKQDSLHFPRVEEFRQLKEQNKLLAPDYVAQRLLNLLEKPEQIYRVHYSVQDLES